MKNYTRNLKTTLVLAVMLGLLAIQCSDAPKGEAIAHVAGDPVTQQQFDAFLKFKRIPSEDKEQVTAQLESYLEREALAKVIENEPLLDRDVIDAELNEFRKEMLISRYFEKFLAENVTEKAIANYYNSNSKDYEEHKIHVAHILLRTNRKMDDAAKQAQATKAQEAYSKVKAGEEFAEAAKTYSEDKVSKKDGGDLGWLKKGAVDPRFTEVVFAMKAGEVSEPFETAFGYHIVKVIEESRTVKKPLRAVEGDIRYQLRAKAKKAEVDRLIAQAQLTKED